MEVAPGWVAVENEADFPSPWPMFNILFALNRVADVVVGLGVHQSVKFIALCKAIADALAMLPDATSKVAGNADI